MLANLKQILFFAFIFFIITWYRDSSLLENYNEEQVITVSGLSQPSVTLVNDSNIQVLYFFAPWCSICHLSIENLEQLKQNYPDISVIAVALDYSSISEVKNFVEQHQLTMPIALGNNDIKSIFKIPGYPSYYVFQNGQISSRSFGYSSYLGMRLRIVGLE
jgi:thiol-disulfide isomerase/thioredoxin